MKTSQIKFEPKASAAVVARAKKWLVDNKKDFKGTANYAVFAETGEPYGLTNQACHYNIQHAQVNGPGGRAVVATECAWDRMTKKASRDWVRPFLTWLLNESYFAPFILNRDDPEFCLEYGFVVSADVWTPLLQNIMIITRSFKESSLANFRKFAELHTEGVPGDLAFVLCFTTNFSNVTKDNHPVGWCGSGHRTTQTFTLEAMLNFLHGETCHDEKVLNDPKKHYRTNLSYIGGNKLFWPQGKTMTGMRIFIDDLLEVKDSPFRKALVEYRKATTSGEMYSPPNPFQKRDPYAVPVNANQISYKELWELFLPWFLANYYNEDGTLKERKTL